MNLSKKFLTTASFFLTYVTSKSWGNFNSKIPRQVYEGKEKESERDLCTWYMTNRP